MPFTAWKHEERNRHRDRDRKMYLVNFRGLLDSYRISVTNNSFHTIRKCKKMDGQNTFEILLLNDANMIGEH